MLKSTSGLSSSNITNELFLHDMIMKRSESSDVVDVIIEINWNFHIKLLKPENKIDN